MLEFLLDTYNSCSPQDSSKVGANSLSVIGIVGLDHACTSESQNHSSRCVDEILLLEWFSFHLLSIQSLLLLNVC